MAFITLHLANHLMAFEGIKTYNHVLTCLRLIYCHPIVEVIILLAFFVQLICGLQHCREIWADKKDAIHHIQAATGLYLGLFVIGHIAMIMVARYVYKLDTGFEFIAHSVRVDPWRYLALPAYGLAIMSGFIHLGCLTYHRLCHSHKALGYGLFIALSGLGVYVTYLIYMGFIIQT